MSSCTTKEPVAIVAGIIVLAEALFAAAAAFGIFEPSPAQVAAVVAIITAVGAFFVRGKVTPV